VKWRRYLKKCPFEKKESVLWKGGVGIREGGRRASNSKREGSAMMTVI
jgi:hypothetical protein